MKKLLSVLLLALFLFNWCGYRVLSYFLEDKTTRELNIQLDNNNYDSADLISFRIPAEHLSPYTNTKLFERKEGQVEIDGIPYSYVKQRLYNDSLELWCIPNQGIIILKSAGTENFKLINDLQYAKHEKKTAANSGISKSTSAEYFFPDDCLMGDIYSIACVKTCSPFSTIYSCSASPVIENPPETSEQILIL